MLLPYPKNDKWGFVDERGNWRIKSKYSRADVFCEGLSVVRTLNGGYGAINHKGRLKIPFVYRELESFHGGESVGCKFGSSDYEIITCSGESVVVKDSKWIDKLGGALFAVRRKSDGFSIVNHKGMGINAIRYQSVLGMDSAYGLIHCKRRGRWCIEDVYGNVSRVFEVEDMHELCRGRAIAYVNGMWGVIDIHGKEIISFGFKSIQRIDDMLDRYVLVEIVGEESGNFHLYDMQSDYVSDWTVDAMRRVSIGERDVYWVLRNDMWSVMNDKFEIIMPNVGYSLVTIKGDNLVRVECDAGFQYLVFEKDRYEKLF